MTFPTAGLLIALAEMAIASGIGAQLLAAPSSIVPHAYWFGEDQARYIVTVPAADAGLVLAKMKGAGVPCARIGTTGGDAIAVAGETPVSVEFAQVGVRALAAGLYERQGVVGALSRRHCERSEAIHFADSLRDGLLVASLLAMTCPRRHSTFVAPGILRNAAVTAQLSTTVSTNAMVALTMAGRS